MKSYFDLAYDGRIDPELRFDTDRWMEENAVSKEQALKMIDAHKSQRGMINPTELLHWTWLRVIINQIPEEDWEKYMAKAVEVMSR
jgi:hypothetical protein